ncbi:MAG: EAL domain-containing protein [Actinomycetota bacterium]
MEDDPLFGKIIERLLAAADPTSASEMAGDLAAARTRLADHDFDVVLTDVSLPDGTGFDLANELAEVTTAPPVVIITGSDDRGIWGEAAEAGATTVLTKSALSEERLAGALEFSYEVTASARAAGLIAALASDLCGAIDGPRVQQVLDRLISQLGLDQAILSVTDADRIRVLDAAVGSPTDHPTRTIVRGHDGWEISLVLRASERAWGRVEATLGGLCDVVLAHAQLAESRRLVDLSDSRHRAVADATADLIMTVDAHGTLLAANAALRDEIGEGIVGSRLRQLVGTSPVVDLALQLLRSVQSSGEASELDDRPVDVDGRRRWYSGRAIPAEPGPDDQAVHLVLSETTGRVLTENELSTLALTDPLTGLSNRRLAMDRIQHALDQVGRRPGAVVVCQFDIDHFKAINDLYGHAAGDAALSAIGQRLRSLVRDADTAARLGGDEFLVVAEGLPDAATGRRLIDRLHSQLGGSVAFADRTFDISVSLGFATVVDRGLAADEVLRRADAALYRAKNDGRNRYVEYEDGTHVFGSVAEVTRELRRAMDEERFRLLYQPIVNGGSICGVEALIRLEHPVHGEIAPKEFVDVLINSPLLVPVGQWVITSALGQVATWEQGAGIGEHFHCHVNVAPQQLSDTNFIDHVLHEIDRTGVEPSRLVIEVTEQSLLDLTRRSSGLARLSEAGVGLYLDDFGTGASSIAHLRTPLLDGLKIDRSFVAGATADPRDADIVDGLISLGHSLGLDVVVEGIERPDQLARFAPDDSVCVQGFVYAPPLPAERLGPYLANGATSISNATGDRD